MIKYVVMSTTEDYEGNINSVVEPYGFEELEEAEAYIENVAVTAFKNRILDDDEDEEMEFDVQVYGERYDADTYTVIAKASWPGDDEYIEKVEYTVHVIQERNASFTGYHL